VEQLKMEFSQFGDRMKDEVDHINNELLNLMKRIYPLEQTEQKMQMLADETNGQSN
jgi:hypothetical protein